MALPNPIAYWKFDEASGTTAADSSGNGHTATLVNGTWDTSSNKKFGTAALANNGSGRGASFTPFSLGTVHSIAFWFNGWDGSNDGVIIGGAAEFYGCYTNTTHFYYSAGSGNNQIAPHGFLINSHHVVITRNGTTLTWYVDGASVGTQTLASNTALTLGSIAGYDNGTIGFAATLDDIRFYDVALTGAQVSELFALDPTFAASARITQDVIEVLSLPVPAARVGQYVIEVLSATTPVPGRVSQYVVEVLSANVEVTPPVSAESTQFYIVMP